MAVKTDIMERIQKHFQSLTDMSLLDKAIKVEIADYPKNDEEYNALEKKASGSIKGVIYFTYGASNPTKTEGRYVYFKPSVMCMVVVRNDKKLRDELLEQVMLEMVKIDFAPSQDFYLSKLKSQKQMHAGYCEFKLARPMRVQ